MLLEGALYTVAAVAPVLVTVLVTPVVTRSLGAEEYGVVGLATTFIQIGLVVLSLGLAEPITRHGLLESSGLAGARWLVVVGVLPSAALTVGVAALSPWWVPALLHTAWRPAWPLSVAAAFLFGVVTNIQAILRSMDRPQWFVGLGMTASLGGPVAGLVAILLVGKSAECYVGGLIIGYAAALILGLPAVRDRRAHTSGDFRRALRMGFPMMFNQIASYVVTALLVTLTTRAESVATGGRVQLALFVGTAPSIVAVAVSNAWAPAIYRTPPADRSRAATAVARDVASVVAVIGGVIALLSPWILAVLVPVDYEPAILARVAAEATAGGVLTVVYLACVHVIMVTGRNMGLAVVVPTSVALAALVVRVLGLDRGVTHVGWGFPIAYVLLAALAVALRNVVGAVRWDIRPVIPWIAMSASLAAAGALLPLSATGTLIRLLGSLALFLLGVRVVRRIQAS